MSAERSSHAHAVRAFKEKCNQQVGTVAERRKRRADAWEEFKKEVHKTEKRKKKKNRKKKNTLTMPTNLQQAVQQGHTHDIRRLLATHPEWIYSVTEGGGYTGTHAGDD